jgi:BASS family bile acid:Na+ symporter
VVLARKHFADPLTAVPCAISSVFHSVIGSVLAGWWRWRDGRTERSL